MKVQEALEASPYESACLEQNGMYTVIDGSLFDGFYTLTYGTIGLPPVTTLSHLAHVQVFENLLTYERTSDQWEPMDEAES